MAAETGLSGVAVGEESKRISSTRKFSKVRDLENPNRLARVRIGLGAVQWSTDETYVLIKRSPEHKSGELVWNTSSAASQRRRNAQGRFRWCSRSRFRFCTG